MDKEFEKWKICIEFEKDFENSGKRIILPHMSDDELASYLTYKFNKKCTFITYDNISDMGWDGCISIGDEDYSFNYNIYKEI